MARTTKSQPSSKSRRSGGQGVGPKNIGLPSTPGDIHPDPALLSPAERMAEFGRLMLRAIERQNARRGAKQPLHYT